jgi:hypothetical protein
MAGQSVWHRDDIAAAMRAVNLSSAAIAQHVDTQEMRLYRLGFDTALAALAVVFGVDWPAGKELTQ